MFGIDFAEHSFARAYRGEPPCWTALPWQAQGLYGQMNRKCHPGTGRFYFRSGTPEAAVALATGWPLKMVRRYLPRLIEAGAVAVEPGSVALVDYERAHTAIATPAARKRAQREREEGVGEPAEDVTPRDIDTSRRVTEPSRRVTSAPVTPRDRTVTPRDEKSRRVTEPSRRVTSDAGTPLALNSEREDTHTQPAHTHVAGAHAHARGAKAAAPREPSSDFANDLLAELRRHPALADVANATLADQLAGNAELAAKRPGDVKAAIADAARDAGARAAADNPLHAPALAVMVAKYCANAKPPRDPLPARPFARAAVEPARRTMPEGIFRAPRPGGAAPPATQQPPEADTEAR